MRQYANESTPHTQSSQPEHSELHAADLTGPGCDAAANAAAQGFFRTLFDKAAEGIVVVDPSTREVVQANPAVGRMFGYPEDRMKGMSVEELHPEETRSFVNSWFESHQPDFRVDHLETECVRCDGRRFLAELRVSMVEMGGRPYVVSFFTDITRRRRAEELMRAQRDLAQTLNVTNDLGIALKVCLTAVISASGMDAGGIYLVDAGTGNLDLVCSEGLPPDFVRTVAHFEAHQPNARAVQSGSAIYHSYVQLTRKMGTVSAGDQLRAIAVVPVKHDGRAIACLNVTSRLYDEVPELARNAIETIAESIGSAIVRIRAEQAVRDSENRFRELTELLPQIVLELDAEGYVTYFNRQGFELTGLSHEDMQAGIHILSVVSPADRNRALENFRAIMSGATCADLELSLMRKEGSTFPVLIYGSPILRDGATVGIRGIAVDITERERAAGESRRQESLMQNVLESLPVGVWVTDGTGNIVSGNKAGRNIWQGARYVGVDQYGEYKGWWPATGKRIQADEWALARAITRGETSLEEEIEIECFDGTRKTILNSALPVRDADQSVVGAIVVNQDITQRKQIEVALRDSEERWHFALEGSGDGVWDWNALTNQVFFSRQWKAMLGYGEDDIGSSLDEWSSRIHPDDLEGVFSEIKKHFAGETPSYSSEHRLRCKDGSYRWILDRGKVVSRTSDGKPLRVIGTHTDICTRKRAEEDLAHTKAFLSAAIEQSPAGVLVAEAPDVKISLANSAALGIRGHAERPLTDIPAELHPANWQVYRPDGTLFRGEDLPLSRAVLEGVTSHNVEAVIRQADGSDKFVLANASPIRSKDGTITAGIVVFSDITEHRRAEAALREREAKLGSIMAAAPIGIGIVSNRVFHHVNKTFCDMVGYSEDELISQSVAKLYLTGEEFDRVGREYSRMATQGVSTIETMWRRKDGSTIEVNLSVTPLDRSDWSKGITFTALDITERKRAEKALQERENRLSSVLKVAPIGIGLVVNRVLMHVNQSLCDMVGYSEDELLNRNARMLYPTDEEYEYVGREKYDQIRKSGSGTVQTIWRRKDGRVIDVLLSSTPLDRSDWSKGVTFTALDITERKRAERDLRAAEEQYRVLFERAGEGIMVASGEYFVLANPAFCALSGYTLDDLVQLRIEDFIHPDHRALVMERYRRRQEGEQVPTGYDFEIVTKSGETKWVRINSTIISWQGRHATLNFVEDITVSREAQEELRKFKTISDSATYGNAITDMHGTLVYVNEAFARMHDYRSDELLGSNLAVLHSDEQQRVVGRINEGLIRAGSFTSAEVWHRRRDGSVFPTLMNGMVIRDGSGQAQFLAATAADITELRRLQEFADRARRLEAAGRIAGQVAHDFNNLLGPLVAYPEFIKEEIGSTHPANVYLDTMEAAAQQMADINQQLLSLGRRGHYNLEPLNLNEVIRQVLQQLQIQSERLEVVTELSGDLMNIKAGAAQIVRALTNLISNAVDAMQSAGTLTVRTQNWYADNPHDAYGQIEKGEYVKVTVSDSGCGIPQQIIGQVFEPFFTTKKADKKRGSGLGLSVVHAIVEDHGGYVDIESAEGRGTSVFLYFPITREEQTAIGDNRIVGGGESILLVDDDRVQQEVTTRLLERLGYRVAAVSSGEEAIEFIRREPVDLVLLDMIMPGGMDGVDTYRYLLEYRPGQKAIIVSGFAEGGRVAEARSLGAGEFLRKPLTLKSLAQTVRRELDRVPDLQPI